jgi:hypothetical protein
VGLIAVAAAASIWAAPLADAKPPKHKPKPKPDLVVKDLEFQDLSPNSDKRFPTALLTNDGKARFGYTVTVKNIGKAKAPKSRAQLFIDDAKASAPTAAALDPGDGASGGENLLQAFPSPGPFQLFICADSNDAIKESNEDNNCSKHVHFAVVPLRWNVAQMSTSLHSPGGGPNFDNASTGGMKFEYLGTEASNGGFPAYTWQATGGTIEHATGTDNGCPVSGTGSTLHTPWGLTLPPNIGVLEITTDLLHYDAYVADEITTYTVTRTCPPPEGTSSSDLPLEALGTGTDGAGILDQAMPSNATTLAGTWGNSMYGGLWQFIADVPPKQ